MTSVMNRRLRKRKAYTVDRALFPVHKMNFVKFAAPAVTCEDDQKISSYLRVQGTPEKKSGFEEDIEAWDLREGMCRRV
jgi:hypothetical protein